MQFLIIGCGDIGLRLANKLTLAWPASSITGLISSTKRAEMLQQHGIEPLIVNLDSEDAFVLPHTLELNQLGIFYLAPPDRQNLADNRIGRVLNGLNGFPKKLIYISTSGIYGNHNGDWVNELTPATPLTDRAKRRVDAEQRLLAWHKQGADISILRVPGIYGPGRLPLAKLETSQPIIDPKEAPYTNLIHADDLAEVCFATLLRGQTGEIYNVGDGQPTTISHYYQLVAHIAGLPEPQTISLAQAQQQYTAQRLSFINESRRLNVSKMLKNLTPNLRYQDLESGIRASLNH